MSTSPLPAGQKPRRFLPWASRLAAWRRALQLAAGGALWLMLAGCAATDAPRPASRVMPTLSDAEYRTADGLRLPLRRWPAEGPPQAMLLAMHGFNDYSQSFEESARHFARAGIMTVAYDQRGFGQAPERRRWAGSEPLVADLVDFIPLLKRENPGLPLYVLGESMGGTVAALALSRTPELPVAGVILVTPAVWTRSAMPWYQRFGIWFGALTTPGLSISSAFFAIAPSDNPEVLRRHRADPLVITATRFDTLSGLSDLMDQAPPAIAAIRQRTLLLYGLRDVMMPRRPMIALHENWPAGGADNFRFALYPDGHHTLLRDRQRQVVWRDLLSWLQDPEAPLPSGQERRRQELAAILRSAP